MIIFHVNRLFDNHFLLLRSMAQLVKEYQTANVLYEVLKAMEVDHLEVKQYQKKSESTPEELYEKFPRVIEAKSESLMRECEAEAGDPRKKKSEQQVCCQRGIIFSLLSRKISCWKNVR